MKKYKNFIKIFFILILLFFILFYSTQGNNILVFNFSTINDDHKHTISYKKLNNEVNDISFIIKSSLSSPKYYKILLRKEDFNYLIDKDICNLLSGINKKIKFLEYGQIIANKNKISCTKFFSRQALIVKQTLITLSLKDVM